MADCTPIVASKACSGKCKGGGCGGTPRVWVVAACEGMVSLFEKNRTGALAPASCLPQGVFASLEQFQRYIGDAEREHAFDQLVVVGSGNDIGWIHASLPQPAVRHIIAEIEYPLLPAWFRQPLPALTHALEGVLSA